MVGLSPYEKDGGLASVAIGFVGENVLVHGAPALAACSLACIALCASHCASAALVASSASRCHADFT